MAIDKQVENEYGAQFTYHKLREVRVINDDATGVQLVLTVQSWLNKQARINGREPTVRQCIIMHADFAMTPFYALLKAKFPDFAEGTDDFDNDFKAVKIPAAEKMRNTMEAKQVQAEYTVQTMQGQLMKRWKEPAQLADTEKTAEPEAKEPAQIADAKEEAEPVKTEEEKPAKKDMEEER